MLYVVSLSVGIYLFLSLESSQIWKHYLITVVKFSCFLRPSPVALPWGIKKIKAFAYGQHWLEWAACRIWAQLILARCCPEQAAHRQHQPWHSLALQARGPGHEEILLWQWCHPVLLLIPSAAATADGYGGVAALWLVLAISRCRVSLGQCEPAQGSAGPQLLLERGSIKVAPSHFCLPAVVLRWAQSIRGGESGPGFMKCSAIETCPLQNTAGVWMPSAGDGKGAARDPGSVCESSGL